LRSIGFGKGRRRVTDVSRQMARRIRTRGAVATAIALAFALSACGSDHAGQATRPPIQGATAGLLAKESEGVAAALDAGDPCGALDRARVLKRQSTAIAAGLPAAVRDQLDAGIRHLIAGIECVPPAPPPPPEHDESKRHEDRGHGKGRGPGKISGGIGVAGSRDRCPAGQKQKGGPGGRFDCPSKPKDEG
jgi:hypothetical protein